MSMLLRDDATGNEFELSLAAERLPDVQDGDRDAVALTIEVRVAMDRAEWQETAPCLSAFELHHLADWLDAVGQGPSGAPEEPELDLLEPELRFSVLDDAGDQVTLRIGLRLDDRPDALAVNTPADDAQWVKITLPRARVRAAAAALRQQLDDLGVPADEDAEWTAPEPLPGPVRTPEEDRTLIERLDDQDE
jgi:hypothetical protein